MRTDAETVTLALLRWHLDASESELRDLEVTKDDVMHLVRAFESEMTSERHEELTSLGRGLLLAYRHGQITTALKKE